MTTNLGTFDRALRLIVGVALFAAAFFGVIALFDNTVLKYIAMIVGLVLAATSIFRFCPMYALFGIRTCRT